MVLVSPAAEFHTLEQLIGDVRVAGGIEECWEPVQAGEDAVLHRGRRHMTGPAQEARHAEAALHDRSFALRERCSAAIWPREDLGAVVRGEDDDGVVVNTKILELLYNQTDIVIKLSHPCLFFRPAILRVAHLLVLVGKMG